MTADLRYPVGQLEEQPATAAVLATAISEIERLPDGLRQAVRGLSDAQLATPYRPGGWTVRQVVHHVADSHLNGFVRTKLALTEDTPSIKPYDEKAWAALRDVDLPVDVSLGILDGLHQRWTAVFRSLSPGQWHRAFVHPEHGRTMALTCHVQMYAWHGRHHVAHITALREREGW